MLQRTEFHPQDWLLIVEALTEYAWLAEVDEPWRADRADELAAAIAREQGLDPELCVEQIDSKWPLDTQGIVPAE